MRIDLYQANLMISKGSEATLNDMGREETSINLNLMMQPQQLKAQCDPVNIL